MIDITTIPEEIQDELLDFRNDSAGRAMFMMNLLTQFWISMLQSYPKLSTEALHVIVPFTSTYLCESGFSTLMHIKLKARYKLDVKDEMKLVITETPPRTTKLASDMQP